MISTSDSDRADLKWPFLIHAFHNSPLSSLAAITGGFHFIIKKINENKTTNLKKPTRYPKTLSPLHLHLSLPEVTPVVPAEDGSGAARARWEQLKTSEIKPPAFNCDICSWVADLFFSHLKMLRTTVVLFGGEGEADEPYLVMCRC